MYRKMGPKDLEELIQWTKSLNGSAVGVGQKMLNKEENVDVRSADSQEEAPLPLDRP